MKYFYSPSTKGFYLEGVHANMPEDVFSVKPEQYVELMTGQMEGKEIYLAGTAKLGLRDQTAPEKTWEQVRAKRDRMLTNCDWTQMSDCPLSDEKKNLWREYRQKLRDLPTAYGKPSQVVWPSAPDAGE